MKILDYGAFLEISPLLEGVDEMLQSCSKFNARLAIGLLNSLEEIINTLPEAVRNHSLEIEFIAARMEYKRGEAYLISQEREKAAIHLKCSSLMLKEHVDGLLALEREGVLSSNQISMYHNSSAYLGLAYMLLSTLEHEQDKKEKMLSLADDSLGGPIEKFANSALAYDFQSKVKRISSKPHFEDTYKKIRHLFWPNI